MLLSAYFRDIAEISRVSYIDFCFIDLRGKLYISKTICHQKSF